MTNTPRGVPRLTLVLALLTFGIFTFSFIMVPASRGSVGLIVQPGFTANAIPTFVLFNHTGWTRARTITIDNTLGESDLVDYQVHLDISYSLAMEPDFHDIRFTNKTGTRLPFWIQSEIDSRNATVFVRVPFIPSHSSVNLTMYYGNPYAGPASSGHDTFDFFDDFGYTDNPANHGWTQEYPNSQATTDDSNYESAPSSLFTQGASAAGRNDTDKGLVKYDLPLRNSLIFEGDFFHNSNTSMIERVELLTNRNNTVYTIGASTPDVVSILGAGSQYYEKYASSPAVSTGIIFAPNQWNTFKLVKTPISFQGFILGRKVGPSVADSSSASGITIGGSTSSAGPGNQPWWFDNIRIRKYAPFEPTGILRPEFEVSPSETAVLTVQPGVNTQVNVTQSIPTLNLQLTVNTTNTIQLLVNRLPTSPVQTPTELTPLGVFFRINANQTTGLNVRIRVYYTRGQATPTDQTTLAPYTYNSKTQKWEILADVTRDIAARWVEGTAHHFSLFGVFSQLVSHAVPASVGCWYCAWWLWAGAGSAGAVGTGAFYKRARRGEVMPKKTNHHAVV